MLAAAPAFAAEERPELLGGVVALVGRAASGAEVRAVPYYAWDNRPAPEAAADWMAIWLRQADNLLLREPLEDDTRAGREHELYRPLPG